MKDSIVDSKFGTVAESVRNIVSSSVAQHKTAMLAMFIVTKAMAVEKYIIIAVTTTKACYLSRRLRVGYDVVEISGRFGEKHVKFWRLISVVP